MCVVCLMGMGLVHDINCLMGTWLMPSMGVMYV